MCVCFALWGLNQVADQKETFNLYAYASITLRKNCEAVTVFGLNQMLLVKLFGRRIFRFGLAVVVIPPAWGFEAKSAECLRDH